MHEVLRVDAVVVPPHETGFAFAHTPSGCCVRLTGPRDAMLELYERVKACSENGSGEVIVDPGHFHDIVVLEDENDCWVHAYVDGRRPAA
jgi:hypothetical protein